MTFYTQSARFDTGRPLDETQLRRLAPSIFASTAHKSRSDRFVPICTYDVLQELLRNGFGCFGAKQSLTRVEGKGDFTKHMLRIRRVDHDSAYQVGDTVAEMLLKNANDGTAMWDLMSSLLRIRCLNSLVAHLHNIDSVKVRHTGKNVMHDVIDGTFKVIESSKLALAAPEQWPQVKLEREEALAFAEAARVIRFGDAEGNVDSPISAHQMLTARRVDDSDRTNLWTVFNVLQENSIRGGLSGVTVNENGRRRRMSTRSINGIDQDVRINRALWIVANKIGESKGVTIAA